MMSTRKKLQAPEVTNRKNLLHKEPSVINEQMILSSLDNLLPTGEQGKYARLDGIKPRQATHLLLDFQNVSQIANLSHMTSLTKLQLCNNILTKIEKLETLVNLVWLDLSYNSIKKIENLENLRKLEFINLHRNLITHIENMDNQLRLEIIIISSNGISSFDQVKYLRRFVRLQSINLEGNPIAGDTNYRMFTIALIPQITFLDYVRISSQEKQSSHGMFKDRLEKIVAADDKIRRRASVVEANEAVRETYRLAFIDGFNEDTFWTDLLAQDVDGKNVLMISDTDDVQAMYHELFRRASKELFDKGMTNYIMRENEIKAYNTALKEEKNNVKLQGQKVTEHFINWSKESLRQMRGWVNLIDDIERRIGSTDIEKYPQESRLKFLDYQSKLNACVIEYVANLHDVWYVIMTTEMGLHEQIMEVNQELEHALQDLVASWLEQLRGYFGVLRDIQLQFNDRLVEDLITYGNYRLSDTTIPSSLQYLLRDKEALTSLIQSSHENHNIFIDSKEDLMVSSLKNWLDAAIVGLGRDEVLRNRQRVSEISHFAEFHRKMLDDKHIMSYITCYVPSVRADQNFIPSEEEHEELTTSKSFDLTRIRISSTLLKLQDLSGNSELGKSVHHQQQDFHELNIGDTKKSSAESDHIGQKLSMAPIIEEHDEENFSVRSTTHENEERKPSVEPTSRNNSANGKAKSDE